MSLELATEITLPDGQKYDQPTGLFIGNEFVKSIDGETLDSINPATGKIAATVYAANEKDVDYAVKVARKAFKESWKPMPGTEKGKLLYKLADLMEANKDLMSAIEAYDSGKPKTLNALEDVYECINVFRYYAGWADKIQGKTIETTPAKFAYTIHEPYGVCGQIIPWNYPIAMAAWKIGPAVAAGNVIVLKTAEQTPLSMLYFGNLVKEAGFPPGVINIISGFGKTAGAALAGHMEVDKIAFTGSTATGRIIQKLASSNLKAVTLECGGKSPLLIFADCDLDQAVKWAAFGIMYNMGQVCTATSRILIEEPIYEEFLKKFKEHVEQEYPQGDPFDDNCMMGPQVTKEQQEKVLKYISVGKEEGAELYMGSEKPPLDTGCYVAPTVFKDVSDEMTIMQEEIFGPVVATSTFKTEEEAVARANNTTYGLGAAIFTKDITRAHKLAAEIESGMVWINSSNDSDFRIPFGGVKMSGIGRELGEYGLSVYTQAKAVHVNLGNNL